jgi:hypothetical protein
MQNNNNAVDSGNIASTKNTGAWTCGKQKLRSRSHANSGHVRTEGVPCHHVVALGASFSEYASPNVATVGEAIGRMLSSELVLERLGRGEDGMEE